MDLSQVAPWRFAEAAAQLLAIAEPASLLLQGSMGLGVVACYCWRPGIDQAGMNKAVLLGLTLLPSALPAVSDDWAPGKTSARLQTRSRPSEPL